VGSAIDALKEQSEAQQATINDLLARFTSLDEQFLHLTTFHLVPLQSHFSFSTAACRCYHPPPPPPSFVGLHPHHQQDVESDVVRFFLLRPPPLGIRSPDPSSPSSDSQSESGDSYVTSPVAPPPTHASDVSPVMIVIFRTFLPLHSPQNHTHDTSFPT
jgi:hypothetical protein